MAEFERTRATEPVRPYVDPPPPVPVPYFVSLTQYGPAPAPQEDAHAGRRGDHPPKTRVTLTRERIVELALEIIDEDGLDALNMRRLAADAGVKPMSLYHHFPNKSAILDAVSEKIAAAALGARRRTRTGRAACASCSWACTR